MARPFVALDPRDTAVQEAVARAAEHPLQEIARFLFRVLRDGPQPHRKLTIRVEPSMGFTTSEVVAIDELSEHPMVELRTRSLGLFGAASPLPHYITEELEASTPRASAARAMLDAIHERLLLTYLEGGETLDIPNEFVCDESSDWRRRMIAVLGLVGPAAQMPVWRIVAMAPALLHGRGSRFSLEMALKLGLGELLGDATLCVDEFTGGWVERADEQVSRLGTHTALLGETFYSGRHVFHPGGGVNIRIAGLSDTHKSRFKEGAIGYKLIEAIASVAAPPEISVQLVVEVAPREHPMLGTRQLGVDFWFPSGSDNERPLEYLLDPASGGGEA